MKLCSSSVITGLDGKPHFAITVMGQPNPGGHGAVEGEHEPPVLLLPHRRGRIAVGAEEYVVLRVRGTGGGVQRADSGQARHIHHDADWRVQAARGFVGRHGGHQGSLADARIAQPVARVGPPADRNPLFRNRLERERNHDTRRSVGRRISLPLSRPKRDSAVSRSVQSSTSDSPRWVSTPFSTKLGSSW